MFVGLILSLLFVLYGSLVPLDYVHRPFDQAWSEFMALLAKGLHVRSRVDLGENFLLMIPAGFFGMGLIWPPKHPVLKFPFAAVVVGGCFCSSVGAEFAQSFFTGRTPALSDILMQTLGSVTGIISWWLWGQKIWTRFFQSPNYGNSMGIFEKILWIYLIGLVGYNIVPFDLTINPYWIYQKYKAGRIILIPFSYGFRDVETLIYGLTTDAIIWIPVGFLWILTKGKRPFEAWFWTLLAVTAIEVVQLFISSRIFDITDILMGVVGGGIGVLFGLKMPFFNKVLQEQQVKSDSRYQQLWIGLGFFCGWCLVLAAVFWFPYEVQIKRKFIETQLDKFFQVPFYVYYYSGGLTAITAVFQKALFFLPLGISLAIAGRPFRKYGINSLLAVISLICFAGAGLVIELGQALMPNKIPDSTDLLFETIGGVLGYWLTLKIYNRNMNL